MRLPSNLDYAPAFLLAVILVAFRLVTGALAGETAERSKDFALAKPWCDKSGEPAVADAAELRMTLARVDDNEGSADESADEQAVHARD